MEILVALILGTFVLVYVPVAVVLKLLIVVNLVLTLVAARFWLGAALPARIYKISAAFLLAVILVLGLLHYDIQSVGHYIFGLMCAVSIYAAYLLSGWLRAAFVNVAAVFAFFALLETYDAGAFPWQDRVALTAYVPSGNGWRQEHVATVRSPVVGYLFPPNTRMKEVRKNGGKLVYEAVYTSDRHGNRVSGFERTGADATIVLVGDSFTFGTGLNDDQTLPTQLGHALHDPRVSIYNLGVGGWSINNVVALLENDLIPEKIGGSKVSYGVYIGLFEHVKRASGLTRWYTGGPRYVNGGAGDTPVRQGSFGEGTRGLLLTY